MITLLRAAIQKFLRLHVLTDAIARNEAQLERLEARLNSVQARVRTPPAPPFSPGGKFQ